MFILGTERKAAGFDIFKLDRQSMLWKKFPGRAMKITVDNEGNPWIISAASKIYAYQPEGWIKISGPPSKQIMSGHDGSIYTLDSQKSPQGYGIWKRNSKQNDWKQVNGKAFSLTVGSNGKLYAIRNKGTVWWPADSCLFPTRIEKPKELTDKKVYEMCQNYKRVVFQR